MESIGLRSSIIILALFLLGCSKAQQGHSQETIANILGPVKEGQMLNDSAWVITIEGDTLLSNYFEDKWLLVDYWTAGCLPCIKEFPVMQEFYKTIDTSKLEIIMLNIDSKKKRWTKAYKKRKYVMPSFYSGWTRSNKFLTINYRVIENENGTMNLRTSTPQYVLIDPNGMIMDKNLPKPSDKKFSEIIESYLSQK